MTKPNNFSRRTFLQSASAGAAALAGGVWSQTARANLNAANDKLNIAFVGTANQARFSINNCKGENVVALTLAIVCHAAPVDVPALPSSPPRLT